MNIDVPALVGVPLMTPVDALSVRPAGRVPDDTLHDTPVTFAVRVAV